MSVQIVHLSRTNYQIPPTVHAVQGDTGRELWMYIDNEGLTAANTAATLCFQRPDGTEYDAECTVVASASEVSYFKANLTQGLTQAGRVKAQLSVTQSGTHVSTYTFYLDVQENISGDITEEQYATVQDAENAAALARTSASQADTAKISANNAAQSANTAAQAANTAAAGANAAAERALTYSGGYVVMTDVRTGKQYDIGFKVTADGEPAIEFTEREIQNNA